MALTWTPKRTHPSIDWRFSVTERITREMIAKPITSAASSGRISPRDRHTKHAQKIASHPPKRIFLAVPTPPQLNVTLLLTDVRRARLYSRAGLQPGLLRA